jgi:hypothetical protein
MNEDRKKIIKQNIINELLECLNSSVSDNIVYDGNNNYLSGLVALLPNRINSTKREFLTWYLSLLQIDNTPLYSVDYLLRLSSSYKKNPNFISQVEKYARINKKKKLPEEVWSTFLTSLLFDFEDGFFEAKIYIINKVLEAHWDAFIKCNLKWLFQFILSDKTSRLLKVGDIRESFYKNTKKADVQEKINERWGFFFYWLNKIANRGEEVSSKISSLGLISYNKNINILFTKEKEEFLDFIEPKLPPFILAHNYSLSCISELSEHFHAKKTFFLNSEVSFINKPEPFYILRPLLDNFVLPPIFYSRFCKYGWDEEQSAFMLHALMGKPLHRFEGLPFKLTQKACNELLTMTEFTGFSFWANLVAAQLLSLGVSRDFVNSVIVLIDRFRGRYDFWINVFELLFKKGALRHELVNLCDYIRFVHFDLNQQIDLKNISLVNLRNRTEEWHFNLKFEKTINEKLPRVDVKPFKYTDPNTESKYCIRQLVTSAELYAEGSWMHHCVFTYTRDCLNKNSFIFSLRQIEGESEVSIVTIQVNRFKSVIQMKGPYNRETTPFEKQVIGFWAAKNNLIIK